jgi:hypothetical protein
MQILTIAVQVVLVGGVLYLGTGAAVLVVEALAELKSKE